MRRSGGCSRPTSRKATIWTKTTLCTTPQLEQRFTEDRAALNSVARQLNRLSWTEIRPVTADFVVAAVDLETAELSDNLKQSAPAEVLADLRARGLVPHD